MSSNNEAKSPQEQEPQANARELEKTEEEKLKAKYPITALRGLGGHSVFLQKSLKKGQKYFDSGDYEMGKQKSGGIKQEFAGKAIPTTESVPLWKTSTIQKL